METCLTHPEFGYYMTRDPIGQAGDFTTAPEISQMFGELIGCWAAQIWQKSGCPTPLKWIELGPGHGTLTADALRAIINVSEMAKNIEVHLVEASPPLRRQQQRVLAKWQPIWHTSLATIPGGPCIIVANEFFDALPVRQFIRDRETWRERLVTLDKTDTLSFVASPRLPINPELPATLADVQNGEIIEVSPSSISIAKALTYRLCKHGGVALIIDYGHDADVAGETLQAVRTHAYASVLDAPGKTDLTAHVNFAELARAAKSAGGATYGPVTQESFLMALGIEARAKQLFEQATVEQCADIKSAFKRLTAPEAMGHLFKVMAIGVPDKQPPPGFEN